MKVNKVTACLVAGICVLSVSATAAFGSINGYANYKTGVKALALDVDNVSGAGKFSMTYDGKEVLTGDAEFAVDGANQSSYVIMNNGQDQSEERSTTYNGETTWYSSGDTTHYYTAEAEKEKTGHGLMNVAGDDELTKRMVNFLELGADTVVGDLKNNVVEISSSNGIRTYQLDIDKDQVPAIVNAGLSVLAYAAYDGMMNTSYVDFEDWDQCAAAYYEKQTGQSLSDDFLAHYTGEINDESWYENNAELDKFEKLQGEMYDFYDQELQEKLAEADSTSGVLYVAIDGATTFYKDVASYEHDKIDDTFDDLESFVGKDLSLDSVHFTFSVNKDGQLTDNHIEAIFSTVDQNDASHSLVLTGDVTFSEYGTTVVQPLDVGDRELSE